MPRLTIIHTNDLHSHFEHWPKLSRYLAATRAAALARGEGVLVVDDGDAMDRVHPLSEATDGQANVDLFNAAGYDAATIGNNEGIGNPHDTLAHLYDHATFPVALANLFEADGTRPAFAQPVVYRTVAGIRVAIIGFTAPYFDSYRPNGWSVRPVADILPGLLGDIHGKYDVLVLLSHLGLPTDRYLAAHYPQLDVIIGGHTHHLLPTGETDRHTLLAAAGKYGEHVGVVTVDVAAHAVTAMRAATVAVADLPEEAGDAATIAGYQARGTALLAAEPVADLPQALTIDNDGPSPLLTAGLAAIAAGGHTDLAALNAGLFLGDLPAGVVTKADLHRVLPHPMHLMVTTLPGTELWRLVMEMEKNKGFLRHFHFTGMSFRGKQFGWLDYRGLTVANNRDVYVDGEPLVPNRLYRLTSLDHYLFLPFFPTLEIVGDNELLFPDFLRTVVGRWLAAQYPLK